MLRISFYRKLLSAFVAVALFTACTGRRDDSQPASSSEAPETSLSGTGSSNDQARSAAVEISESVASVYTPLDLENCEVLETDEESGGQLFRCDGYQGIPLYVTDEGGRFDVDAGVPNAEWTTAARPYNSIGDTVEWRIHDGKPVATILRYNFTTDGIDQIRTSELAVTSIGREGSPGCLIEWVEADAQPDQNTAARQVADRRAEGFDCDSSSAGPSSGGPALVTVIENDEYQPEAVQALPSTTAEALTGGSDELGGWTWEGVLPDDGVYRVRVAHSGPAANQGAVSPYSLTVKI